MKNRQLTSPFMNPAVRRWLFIMPQDWRWWVWLVMACLLLIGLMSLPEAFLAALFLSSAQSVLFLVRERAFKAFPVQLRLAYTLLLIICFFPPIHWLYWMPALGTLALVVFGYCLMARMLSLLPWNRTEPITADLLRRTFLSRPRLLNRPDSFNEGPTASATRNFAGIVRGPHGAHKKQAPNSRTRRLAHAVGLKSAPP